MSQTEEELQEQDRREALSRVGSVLEGRWRLERLLGVGGMGAVYAATHVSGRRAAFKIMHRRHAHDDALLDRFLAERAISQRVRHPSCLDIVAISVTDDDVPLLFMELLEGETLEQARRRVPRFDRGHALRIAETLLEFLVACHAAGVVHRDLKPGNVFLTVDGGIKVIDFGVARESSRRRTTGRLAIGTPSYMPPEQALGLQTVDARADLFAVGAILYALLTGRELREAASHDEQLALAAREPVRSIALASPGIPQPLARVIHKALAWDVDDRYASAVEMLAALVAVQQRLPAQGDESPLTGYELDEPNAGDRPTLPQTPSSIRSLEARPTPSESLPTQPLFPRARLRRGPPVDC